MLAKVLSGTVVGLDGVLVNVEVDITQKGFGAFKIVGLPDKAVDEAKDRVRTAIENSGLDFTKYRLTVNLAPADLPKEGPTFDLPIAIGVLLTMQKIKTDCDLSDSIFFGELSLDGSLNSTPAILPLTMLAKEKGIRKVYVPAVNAAEASIVDGVDIYAVNNLKELVLHLNQEVELSPTVPLIDSSPAPSFELGLEDVKGQEFAKRALIVAAAGGHNIIFTGPPGAGKTLLARVLPGLLPSLTNDESLTVSKIHSITHSLDPQNPLVRVRPFRSPHHSTSRVGLIGGSSNLLPGEISMAHRGVLFLDEIPEFPRSVLESLRQPMEDGHITISRARGTVRFPASFMLVASSNPCPCGWLGSTKRQCVCSATKVANYQRRLSGPLLDRIDIHTVVRSVDPGELIRSRAEMPENQPKPNETVHAQKQIQDARKLQLERFSKEIINTNAEMNSKQVGDYCPLDDACRNTLINASQNLGLSARSIHKIIKVARTIADLNQSASINEPHLIEALSYRKAHN